MQGVLRVGDEIEVRPGIVTKDPEGNVRVRERGRQTWRHSFRQA